MLSTNFIETESENNESIIENDIEVNSSNIEETETETDSLHQIFSPENDQLPFSLSRGKRKIKTSYQHSWRLLLLISIFYGLPTTQYIFYQISDPEVRKEQCYFNNKCVHQIGSIVSFNNVISNLAYILLSITLYFIIFKYDNTFQNVREYYLIICVIISMLLEGIYSSLYHLCPSRVNLQFDTTFMFFFGVFMIIYILQKTRKNDLIDISKLFLFMGFLIFMNTINLTLNNNSFEWIFVIIIFPISNFIISANVYFGHTNWSFNIFYFICRLRHSFANIRRLPNISYLFCLIIINVLNLCLLITSIFKNIDFSKFLLGTLFIDYIIVLIHHIALKINSGVWVPFWKVLIGIFTIIMICLSLYFYQLPTIDDKASQEDSAKYNRPCVLFDYFDTHDVWHFLSAIGMFSSILFVWLLD
jgi:hypothetical protein